MKKTFVLAVLLATSSAWAGVSTTRCANLDNTIQVDEYGVGNGTSRYVSIEGKELAELGYLEKLSKSTFLDSQGPLPGPSTSVYAVKAEYSDASGAVKVSDWLLCKRHYGP